MRRYCKCVTYQECHFSYFVNAAQAYLVNNLYTSYCRIVVCVKQTHDNNNINNILCRPYIFHVIYINFLIVENVLNTEVTVKERVKEGLFELIDYSMGLFLNLSTLKSKVDVEGT